MDCITTSQVWEIGDCVDLMLEIPGGTIDMVLTSPPYDGLRDYGGKSNFVFEETASELYRVMKDGATMVWVVGDATKNLSESGTSFRQALHFINIGLKLSDTMIWDKGCMSYAGGFDVRYAQSFDYMFVLTKGRCKTFHPIKDKKNITAGQNMSGPIRQRDGSMKPLSVSSMKHDRPEYGARFNIWRIPPETLKRNLGHPAPMNAHIAYDHIRSWSNPGDCVLDPFLGGGTTLAECKKLHRNGIGFEINPEYEELIRNRLNRAIPELR